MELPENGVVGYCELAYRHHTDVCFGIDKVFIKDIIHKYKSMRYNQLYNTEFWIYALSTLLRRDPRFPYYKGLIEWRTERILQLEIKRTSSGSDIRA
jgi:hypothetical protein